MYDIFFCRYCCYLNCYFIGDRDGVVLCTQTAAWEYRIEWNLQCTFARAVNSCSVLRNFISSKLHFIWLLSDRTGQYWPSHPTHSPLYTIKVDVYASNKSIELLLSKHAYIRNWIYLFSEMSIDCLHCYCFLL